MVVDPVASQLEVLPCRCAGFLQILHSPTTGGSVSLNCLSPSLCGPVMDWSPVPNDIWDWHHSPMPTNTMNQE